jgi:hypothetical protein
MCRRYHLAYIEAGEVAGAKIRAEAEAWAKITKAEAYEYSVRVRAEADKYKADIQVEMKKWRAEYILKIKLDIEHKLIIEIKSAEDDAARGLADRIAALKAEMDAELKRLRAWYDGQILIIKNDGDDKIAKLKIEIDI